MNFVVIDIGLESVPPLLFTALRFGLTALPAIFFVSRPVGILIASLVRGEHPTWGELLGSLVALVGLGLTLGLVEALALSARRRQALLRTTRDSTSGEG